MWWLWLSAGAVIGFVAAAWFMSGKCCNLQDQVDTKCQLCPLMADWRQWQKQEKEIANGV